MNKYSENAKLEISNTMHRFAKGNLKSGTSKRKVTNRNQALAIGISEARKKNYKVPK